MARRKRTQTKDQPEMSENNEDQDFTGENFTESAAPADSEEMPAADEVSDDDVIAPSDEEDQNQAPAANDNEDNDVSDEKQEVTAEDSEEKDYFTSIQYQLDDYIEKMNPKNPQNSATLSRNQMSLRSIIEIILSIDSERFNDAWTRLIKVVRNNRKTVFNEAHVFRGVPNMPISSRLNSKFQFIVSLLLTSADSQNPRNVSNNVNIDKLMQLIDDKKQADNIISYYQQED